MNDWYLIFLRLIHITGGTLWLGAALFIALFLEPTVRSMGPDGGRVMEGIVKKQRLPVYMELCSWSSVIAGILLYWRMTDHLQWDWIKTTPGLTWTVGGAVAIFVAFMGEIVNAPTAKEMSRLGQELRGGSGPPPAEKLAAMGKLQERMRRAASQIEAALLIFVIVSMAIGRYLHI